MSIWYVSLVVLTDLHAEPTDEQTDAMLTVLENYGPAFGYEGGPAFRAFDLQIEVPPHLVPQHQEPGVFAISTAVSAVASALRRADIHFDKLTKIEAEPLGGR